MILFHAGRRSRAAVRAAWLTALRGAPRSVLLWTIREQNRRLLDATAALEASELEQQALRGELFLAQHGTTQPLHLVDREQAP